MYEYITNFMADPNNQTMLINSAEMFIQLLLELTVLFIAISYAVALINQKLPAERIQRLLGGRHGRGYLTAAVYGGYHPIL
ncbi:hypothetical protein ACLKMH_19360 [Psychromonas sp. KJ10-10]|uniref:hypothetical protein n=1 Tax=Psychromonas sp. KJ10-10 TaxID=3391823 RepID=UPI0039B3D710